MKVKEFKIDLDGQIQEPFLRAVLNGSGCGQLGCNCSPKNFISISNGAIGLTVGLSGSEAQSILSEQWTEIVN